jgi:hypothetical protein
VSPARVVSAIGAEASATLRDTAKVIAWGLVLYGAVALIATRFSATAIGSLALQMVVAEWGAGRLAVAWSDPTRDLPKFGDIAGRIGRGAAMAFVAAGLVIVFGLATHGLSAHANALEPSQLGVGLFSAALAAARDELLLRGIPLRAFRHVGPTSLLLLVAGGAAAAAEYGLLASTAEGIPAAQLVIAGLSGIVFASLWIRDRGGWLAFGAHTAWTLATGAMIGGGILDLRPSSGRWGGVALGGDAGFLRSPAMAAALVPIAAFAVVWSRRAPKS